jgi:predicted kinase
VQHEPTSNHFDYSRRPNAGGIAIDLNTTITRPEAGFCFLGIFGEWNMSHQDNVVLRKDVVLHLVCGKIASGKSTLAAQMAQDAGAVLISEDVWLSRLFPDEIRSVADYVRSAKRIKEVLSPHVEDILRTGVSVVLDLPFNTVESRAWGRVIAMRAQCAHRLHYLDVPDAVCKSRLHRRNEAGEHPFQTTEAQFDYITGFFCAPDSSENLDVVVHAPSTSAD